MQSRRTVSRWFVTVLLVFLVPSHGKPQAPQGTPQPLGELVDVGGYRVHPYCIGNGSPTVVITGAGYSFDWSLVQPEVAKFTRVCAYDHSGIAWSDPGPTDSCSLRVGEINSALKDAGITGPYVLVEHSLGALVSRLYASKYGKDVSGIVIVDHATLGRRIIIAADAPSAPRRPQQLAQRPPQWPPQLPNPNVGFEKLPKRDYQLHVWANSQPGLSQVMKRNLEMGTECRDEVETATQNQPTPLGDKPFVAVSQPAAKELHTELLPLSSNSKQVVAENSGHYVMVDRPDVVINAIRQVVEAARNHTKLEK